MTDIYLFNSLTRKKEKFVPLRKTQGKPIEVGMYTCGMTVYDYAHIGHGRKYVTDDILKRVLTANDYKVKHVQNVTDVGHLVSDADEGEDKLEKGAVKTGKTVWEVADFFTKHFYNSMDKLNIVRPDVVCKATDHIEEQVELIGRLFKNGFAYDTPEAVYFDTTKFKTYSELSGQKISEKRIAVREGVKTGKYKKDSHDFALWFKRVGRFKDHTMHWDSPWGDGFPGWHIECSAMGIKYLGEQFDIHTGGEDHIPVHHTNEIAQSEGATGKKPFVKYWLHYAFLVIDGKKMSKSLGNYYTIEDIVKKGFDPLALRYLYLTAHYRDPLNFTWKSLKASQVALEKLRSLTQSFKNEKQRTITSKYKDKFLEALNDDLNTPQALAVLWEMLKGSIPSPDKYDLALSFDEVLGLKLDQIPNSKLQIPNNIKILITKRNKLRKEGKFEDTDKLRQKIQDLGFTIKDEKFF